MKKLKVNFKYCYGIRDLEHTFDFSNGNTFSLYAPNGVMKTSFAKSFKDASKNIEPQDKIFKSRSSYRTIQDEMNVELDNNNIFVIEPYLEDYKSEKISTLLVNKNLKDKYDEIHNSIDKKKETLLKEIKRTSKIKEIKDADGKKKTLEEVIAKSITHDEKQFFLALKRIKSEVLSTDNDNLSNVPYNTIFNEKVDKIVKDKEFINELENYISVYDKLLSSSTFFRKGVFNHNNAEDIAKNLKNNGFFNAEHSIIVNITGQRQTIDDEDTLTKTIQDEKDSILTNTELKVAFDKVDNKLKGNQDLKNFREYFENNKDLIPELKNIDRFEQKILIAYIKTHKEAYSALIEEFEAGEPQIQNIIEEAKNEATSWQKVIEIFNSRFFVPFKISMSNQAQVILNNAPPSLTFLFKNEDTSDFVPVEETDLIRVLSNGERRSLYILNIIFEVEARKSSNSETLFVIDDIADSFDYKNKYAIIEYLNEISKFPFFKQIVLTHNFDFYRTISGRLGLKRQNRLHVKKSSNNIKIEEEHYQNSPFDTWKKHLHTRPNMLIASIPFVRNLAEYCGYKDDFLKLTSLLHIKIDTNMITVGDLESVIKNILKDKNTLTLSNRTDIVKNLIYRTADEIQMNNLEHLDLEDKIVLSIAIRLRTEEFMLNKLPNLNTTELKYNQTIELISSYNAAFPNDKSTRDLLDRVNLMTPENIHLNSFMYEPILDMSVEHLKQLYIEVSSLQ